MICLGDDEVTALLTGALEGEAFAVAEVHLDVCRRCRLLVSTLATKTGDTFRNGSLNAFGIGDVVAGRYQIVALLGSGGMGEVYETLDTVLGERVALKTLAAGIAVDETGVSRLKAEVQIARRVTHRNVCRVFDVGFHTDVRFEGDDVPNLAIPFFTMELLRGETLRKRLRCTGPLSCSEVLSLLEQIVAGIDAAHAAGIVHRDLKTENVMLVPEEGDDARVVITDFGLAHQFDEQALRRMPLTRHAAGTLGYMAPEQLAGEQPRPATDIYALGVVLFELLTGELPFSVAEAIGAKERRGPPPSLRSFCAAPPAWQTAIDRCLEVLPSARFGSASELLSALRASSPPPRRHRIVGRSSLGAALTVLIVGASVLAARREAPPRAAALKVVETPPVRPIARAVLPPPPATRLEVGPSARPGSAELPRSSPLGRARHARRRAGERSVPARTPEAFSADDRLGDDDLVDPFVQPLVQPLVQPFVQPLMQPSIAPSHTK